MNHNNDYLSDSTPFIQLETRFTQFCVLSMGGSRILVWWGCGTFARVAHGKYLGHTHFQ